MLICLNFLIKSTNNPDSNGLELYLQEDGRIKNRRFNFCL